ncbi:UvrD-helicase domain-containing protein [Pullulanibacillus sp. KACC 23026]|uniref:HelD family protein n=1 Tax=Pullulanibacillus sp. KACC 23026 TaxID=3028315 RepID=UPI0023B004AC|nr:UvrD-helicase domain-containing protein [Pullulanibacillus sp. KACC 23026]WEG13236.1 UvrD-helicase domain-containing protein [Pullulanibacillus sp. KACC 23026]
MEESQSAYREEQQQLQKVAAEIKRQLADLESKETYHGEDFTEQILEEVRETSRSQLRLAENEPYFGRLDFLEEGLKEAKPLYIGKIGVADGQKGDLLVIDWRAPIASLFYAFTGAEEDIYYTSPDGIVDGDIFLKRNIVIRQKELERVVDVYVKGQEEASLSDEFLLYRLGENKDNKLRDIVSTIQAEQNAIIRAPRNAALIIQGVAGSGKTTVALHRLAYLIYEYREKIKAEKMIIFAPNNMFLDYISNVLPELGVGGIQQMTFEDWALELLEEPLKLEPHSQNLSEWFSPLHSYQRSLSPGRIKGSAKFKQWLETCLTTYESQILPSVDFEPWEGKRLQLTQMNEWIEAFKNEPVAIRRERLVTRMKGWIDARLKEVSPSKKSDLRKKATLSLRNYLKKWPAAKPVMLYQTFLKQAEEENLLNDFMPKSLIKDTIRSLKNKVVTPEDLPPLVLIHFWLNGNQNRFHHVVIDEAQDFSPFQVALLRDQTVQHSFTILGDLSQGIHDYKGIDSWEEFRSCFKNVSSFELEKSYRSTMEIIEFANAVLTKGYDPVVLASPVFRSGDEVMVKQVDRDLRETAVKKWIQDELTKGLKSLAIVTRTEADCLALGESLLESGVDVSLFNGDEQTYAGGVSILPIYLTKGLEFDAVLILDATEENYKKEPRDAKLLYVGCTRALHHLSVFYDGNPSPLLPF